MRRRADGGASRIRGVVALALGAGTLSLMLLLSLPGVTVVRAAGSEGPVALGSETAGICPAHPAAGSGASLDQILARLAAGAPSAEAGDDTGTRSLDGRGYNYGPAATGTAPALLHFELRNSPMAEPPAR